MRRLYAFIIVFLLVSCPSKACLRPVKEVVMPPKELKKLHDKAQIRK